MKLYSMLGREKEKNYCTIFHRKMLSINLRSIFNLNGEERKREENWYPDSVRNSKTHINFNNNDSTTSFFCWKKSKRNEKPQNQELAFCQGSISVTWSDASMCAISVAVAVADVFELSSALLLSIYLQQCLVAKWYTQTPKKCAPKSKEHRIYGRVNGE